MSKSTTTTRLEIQGMTCTNCARTITDAIEPLDGVIEVNINVATDKGTVEYDSEQISLGEIYDAIESAGYSPIREDDDETPSDAGTSTQSQSQSSQERRDAARKAEITHQFRLTLYNGRRSK